MISKDKLKIAGLAGALLATVGIALGVVLGTYEDDYSNEPVIEEVFVYGWQSWTPWTECSVTCGYGEQIRSRECLREPGESTNCSSDEIVSIKCLMEMCKTGQTMVHNEREKLRSAGFEDNLFLNRYAKTVTKNGMLINNEENSDGHGVWRLTKSQIQELLPNRGRSTEKKLLRNLRTFCKNESDSIDFAAINLTLAIEYADNIPCFSMTSLLTYLEENNLYDPSKGIPLNPNDQLAILQNISNQVAVNWSSTLDDELDSIKEQCSQTDIDFEFVVDSSTSVKVNNWQKTMMLLGNYWIKDVISPRASRSIGNHVAGRWFSDGTRRFYDFEPPPKEVFINQTYPEYVADQFMAKVFEGGGTQTDKALKEVRLVDLPMARSGLKYVMLFTDGQSNNNEATVRQAKLLHAVADRTYALGIGGGINTSELHQIASDPAYVGRMTDFDELKAFVRLFVVDQKGCESETKGTFQFLEFT